ncbi:MAG: preprotein translocase subunit YajC [Candidatus Andeanibacterium colombiense]|uniref:Preprotein translocase subunit YajC n=1 Tax=Candidatus Andeanibacterium colombiense TaxID=3121345 RepID=A0AAJ5X770_9SPHN|nr:MAG: preprotein translocase subunit YajC [Sphingomonadaceae bacterium]
MRRIVTSLLIALAAVAAPQAAFAQDDEGAGSRKHIDVSPYIEAAQVVSKEFSPGDDFVTYTRIAAGVDANVQGRNSGGSVSLRYERRIGWRDGDPDGDLISGIARIGVAVLPNKALTIEAGGMAAQTRVTGNGSAILSPVVDNPGKSNIYAAYAGPSVHTNAGDLDIQGHYRFGYAKVEEPDALVTAPGADPLDVFDQSTIHDAEAHIGIRPQTVLPVGIGLGGGWVREDVSNLDQRVENRWARGDLALPLGPSLEVVGGVGYENVKVSNRDVLRDGSGDPVIGKDGRYVTDKSAPRQISFDTEGLIWDAGVVWRPSRRTELEAHVGRRYGSMSYYGSLSYKPSPRTSFNVGVYDTMSGFGGQVTNALAELPTDFEAVRNPISGDIGGCVESLQGGQCLTGVLNGIRSSTFRARGVAGTVAVQLGRLKAGIGAGYDNRKFIGAKGTILEDSSGVIDESVWAAAYLNGRIDENSSFSTSIYANWLDSGFDGAGSSSGYGASASYYRSITQHVSATAAVSVDGESRGDGTEDTISGAAMLGMRYSF